MAISIMFVGRRFPAPVWPIALGGSSKNIDSRSGLEREMGSTAKEKLAEVLPLYSVIRLASAKTENLDDGLQT